MTTKPNESKCCCGKTLYKGETFEYDGGEFCSIECASTTQKKECAKCKGEGWYQYSTTGTPHMKPCEVCCPHDQGTFPVNESHYCLRGCGEEMKKKELAEEKCSYCNKVDSRMYPEDDEVCTCEAAPKQSDGEQRGRGTTSDVAIEGKSNQPISSPSSSLPVTPQSSGIEEIIKGFRENFLDDEGTSDDNFLRAAISSFESHIRAEEYAKGVAHGENNVKFDAALIKEEGAAQELTRIADLILSAEKDLEAKWDNQDVPFTMRTVRTALTTILNLIRSK